MYNSRDVTGNRVKEGGTSIVTSSNTVTAWTLDRNEPCVTSAGNVQQELNGENQLMVWSGPWSNGIPFAFLFLFFHCVQDAVASLDHH